MSESKTKAECPAGAGAKGLAKECAKGYQHSLSQQEARTREARQLKTYYSLQEDRPDVKVKLSSKLRENFSQYSKEAPTWAFFLWKTPSRHTTHSNTTLIEYCFVDSSTRLPV